MKIGKNLAVITDYGTTKTKMGSVQVFIRLSFEDNTESTWYGVPFKKDGEVNTMMLTQLAYCGFDISQNVIDDLSKGPDSGLLVMDEQMDVYCRMEMGASGEQELRINSLGAIGPVRSTADEVKALITDDQRAKLAAVAEKFKPRARKQKPKAQNPEEDILF